MIFVIALSRRYHIAARLIGKSVVKGVSNTANLTDHFNARFWSHLLLCTQYSF